MRATVSTLAAVLALAAPAAAGPPVDKPGPPLSVPQATLDASLQCNGTVGAGGPTPVLLVPGTGEDPDFYNWNYMPALTKLGIAWCSVTFPSHATADIQLNGEYVVNAIRTMYARAGRRISIIGHSQGGMVPRWALRFWPDTRQMVDDLIGLAPSNHGTMNARATCGPGGCNAASWQQRDDSKFIAALNDPQETFAGISYTVVYTHTDEVVTPNGDEKTGSSALRTGTGAIRNVAIQDLCPNDTAEHLQLGSSDPVGYALAIDALTHDGPADPSRFDPTVCAQPAQPGVNPATGPADASAAYAKVLNQFGTGSPSVNAEPPLACYATGNGTCPGGAAPAAPAGQPTRRPHRLLVWVSPRRPAAGRRTVLRVLVRWTARGKVHPVAGATVRVAGHRVRTNRNGRATIRARLHAGRVVVRATRSGYRAGSRAVRVRPRR